jgi:outer membrane protein OmpA-like peptidoglycan-associated protein
MLGLQLNRVALTLAAGVISAACAAMGAFAQSQAAAPPAPKPSAAINVACGDPNKSSCALVLPQIAAYSARQGLVLAPVATLGSVQSAADDVCPGKAQAAIGMADGFDAVRKSAPCATSFDVIGHPLFPYFGYLIVSNAVPVSTLDNLVNNLGVGQMLTVSDGKPGTGGQVTFANILASNPAYQHLIVTTGLDQDAALDDVQNIALHAYFVMDGPGSPVIQAIANATDAHGNPLYKFLSIDPGPGYYGLKDAAGDPLYHEVTINAGFMGFGSTTTVSTDAVVIVNHAWAQDPANAQALSVLQLAANQADADIRTATKTPASWNGDSTGASDYVVLAQSAPTSQQLIAQLKPAAAPPAPPATPAAAPAPAPVPAAVAALPVNLANPASPAAPATMPAPAVAAPPVLASTNLDIDFASGSAALLPDDIAALDGLGQALSSAQLSGYNFKIIGHTDTVGDPSFNKALSLQRAASVKAYLEAKYGIADARLQVAGLGESDLLVATPPNTPNQSNRRVEIVTTGSSS